MSNWSYSKGADRGNKLGDEHWGAPARHWVEDELLLLKNVLPTLPQKDQGFAASLLSSCAQRGATDKQLYWIEKLLKKAVR